MTKAIDNQAQQASNQYFLRQNRFIGPDCVTKGLSNFVCLNEFEKSKKLESQGPNMLFGLCAIISRRAT
jgi:hypothetical protein